MYFCNIFNTIQYNLEYLTRNKNHLVMQTHHFMLEILLLVYCFYTVFLYFSTCNTQISFLETIFYSLAPLPPTNEHSHIYLQLCAWDDYHIFLIAPLVFTRLKLDDIYHLIELLFDWLIMWCDFLFIWRFDSRFFLQQIDTENRWKQTRINYHCCITSQPTNQVC